MTPEGMAALAAAAVLVLRELERIKTACCAPAVSGARAAAIAEARQGSQVARCPVPGSPMRTPVRHAA